MTNAKIVIYIGLLVLFCRESHAQQTDSIKQVDLIDYLEKFLKIENDEVKRSNKKTHFSFFPTQSSASGGKISVSSVNATFLLGDKSTTNVSTIYLIPYISF